MNPTLKNVKKATEKMVCAKHKEKPQIKFVKDEIQLTTCCEAFRKKVLAAAEKAYNKSIQDQILGMFGG